MNKIRLTVAQALIKFLDNQFIFDGNKESKFIEGIFAIFGHGNVIGIGEALAYEKHELKFHQAYNEQSMGHIAIGFAKQKKNKQIYAVTSSVGPGAANMVTSAATATANRIPVLFLPGDVFANRQPDPVLQQIEQPYDLSLSTNDSFKNVSVYWDRIDRPEKLMSAMINAMLNLTNPGRQGAVTISLPQDVQGEVFDYPLEFFKRTVYDVQSHEPKDIDIKKIISEINLSKCPLIIIGGGVKYSDSEKLLIKLTHSLGIPFAETQAGKGAVSFNNEMNLGGIGTTGFLAANIYAKKADLIIGLGTRYSDFTTASKSLFKKDAMFINVNASRFDANKMSGYMVVSDINKTLKKILKVKNINKKVDNLEFIKKLKEKANKEIIRLQNIKVKNINSFIPEVNDHESKIQLESFYRETNSLFTQTEAIGIINNNIDESAIVVASAGSLPGDLQRMWNSNGDNTYHVEYGYSCMGYEIAATLGVKFANPKREVYSMVGDGSYMMLHTALLTSIQENKKINVMLFNNSSFGCINNLQVSKGINSLGTEFRRREEGKDNILDGNIMHVNYSMQALGYGVKTYRVKNSEELLKAIEDSKKSKISTLIEIIVLPKTMTHGYESWWRVGNTHLSKNNSVNIETANDLKIIKDLKGY